MSTKTTSVKSLALNCNFGTYLHEKSLEGSIRWGLGLRLRGPYVRTSLKDSSNRRQTSIENANSHAVQMKPAPR